MQAQVTGLCVLVCTLLVIKCNQTWLWCHIMMLPYGMKEFAYLKPAACKNDGADPSLCPFAAAIV